MLYATYNDDENDYKTGYSGEEVGRGEWVSCI